MKRWAALAFVMTTLSGCATVNQMAFDKTAKQVDTRTKSVVLMTIDVSRDDDSRYVPNPIVVKLGKPNAQTKEERQNFLLNKVKDTIDEDGHRIFLARMALEPGAYTLFDVTGEANAFPFHSLFVVPLWANFEVAPHSITSVGRVTAKLRPRTDKEFRAGPVVPLVDQAVTGIAGGTWDIVIDDRSAKDVASFRKNFEALSGATIDSIPLPAFDRGFVQRLWDGESVGQVDPRPAAASSASQ